MQSSKLMEILKHPIRFYKNILQKRPVIVQSIQTGVLYGCSDILAQTFVEKASVTEINVKRTFVFITTGAIFTGPIQTIWFRFLARKIGTTGTWVPVKKVVIDQFGFVPIFHISLITIVNALHGHDVAFIKEQIHLKYVDILLMSVKVWPAIQLLNFKYTPLNYQVLVGQVVALFWNIYLSWKSQHGIIRNI